MQLKVFLKSCMVKKVMTKLTESRLLHKNPFVNEGARWAEPATKGLGGPCQAQKRIWSDTVWLDRSVEPKLSRPFNHTNLNVVKNDCRHVHTPALATTVSRAGCGALD